MVCVIVRRPVPSDRTGPSRRPPSALAAARHARGADAVLAGARGRGRRRDAARPRDAGTRDAARPRCTSTGSAGSSNNWTELAGRPLGALPRVRASTCPGSGAPAPPSTGDYRPAAHADTVVAYLEDLRRQGSGPVHLLGNSLGGAVSLLVAAAATRPRAHADPRQPGDARPAPAALAPRRQARGAGAAAPARRPRPGRAGGADAPRAARPHHGALPRRPRGGRAAALRHGRRRRPRSARRWRGRPRRCTARSSGWWARGARRRPRSLWAAAAAGVGADAGGVGRARPPRRRRSRRPHRRDAARRAPAAPAGVGHVAQIERPEIVARAVLGLFDAAADGSWPAAGRPLPGQMTISSAPGRSGGAVPPRVGQCPCDPAGAGAPPTGRTRPPTPRPTCPHPGDGRGARGGRAEDPGPPRPASARIREPLRAPRAWTRPRGRPAASVLRSWRTWVVPALVVLTVLAVVEAVSPDGDAGSASPLLARRRRPRRWWARPRPAPGRTSTSPPRSCPRGGAFPATGAGTWHVIPGTTPQAGTGRVYTYTVEVEDGAVLPEGDAGLRHRRRRDAHRPAQLGRLGPDRRAAHRHRRPRLPRQPVGADDRARPVRLRDPVRGVVLEVRHRARAHQRRALGARRRRVRRTARSLPPVRDQPRGRARLQQPARAVPRERGPRAGDDAADASARRTTTSRSSPRRTRRARRSRATGRPASPTPGRTRRAPSPRPADRRHRRSGTTRGPRRLCVVRT